MNIRILQLIPGAREARGLTVIIDVFRAFTIACYFIDAGAQRIIPVGDLDLALRLGRENPDFVLMGERGGKIVPGFAYGNSPTHIEGLNFSGRTIVQTTSAGTQGIVNALRAEEIITGSFVNAAAVCRYIRSRRPREVSLVCMGHETVRPSEEDTLFAEYVKNELEGRPNDFPAIVRILRATSGARFFDPANADSQPPRDFELSLSLDRFDFVLRAEPARDLERGLVELRRVL